MWINQVTLGRFGYDKKECRNIVKAIEQYAVGEERMEKQIVSGNRHGMETMEMRLFVKSFRAEDFLRACRRKIEHPTKNTKVARWKKLIGQIEEMMEREAAA